MFFFFYFGFIQWGHTSQNSVDPLQIEKDQLGLELELEEMEDRDEYHLNESHLPILDLTDVTSELKILEDRPGLL